MKNIETISWEKEVKEESMRFRLDLDGQMGYVCTI